MATTRPRTKTHKPGRTEKQVSQQVVEAAAMLGVELKRRNVGMAMGASGRAVRFGEPGDGDFYAVLDDGRHLDLELKKEGFNPNRLRGKAREHFDQQLARLKRTNEQGGVGLWVDDSELFIRVMRIVLDGGRVVESGYGPLEVIAR